MDRKVPGTTILRSVAVGTAALTYLLVVLGSTVRVTKSGMGCPSWPLCYGHLGYVDRFHAILEQSHRYLASVVTIGIAVTAVGVERLGGRSRSHRAGRRPQPKPYLALRKLTRWSVVLVGVQVVLGAITVFAHNAPVTVGVHLVAAFTLLGVVTAVATVLTSIGRAPTGSSRGEGLPRRTGHKIENWAVSALLATVAAGGFVVDSGVAAKCRSLPTCPSGSTVAVLTPHLLHRSLAAVAVALVVGGATKALLRGWSKLLPVAVMSLAGLQLLAGAEVAILGAPAVLQDLHLALAAALWVSAVALAAQANWGQLPAERSDWTRHESLSCDATNGHPAGAALGGAASDG
ncbi:MAG: COX15/CtaA family protein [Actinomycetota bacterium]|nr:COX15/CtaA family protein [Actinomycetota bacterium]